jgi:hypothetical protein
LARVNPRNAAGFGHLDCHHVFGMGPAAAHVPRGGHHVPVLLKGVVAVGPCFVRLALAQRLLLHGTRSIAAQLSFGVSFALAAYYLAHIAAVEMQCCIVLHAAQLPTSALMNERHPWPLGVGGHGAVP